MRLVDLGVRIRTFCELLAQELSNQRVKLQGILPRCKTEIACRLDHLMAGTPRKSLNRRRSERRKERQTDEVLA